ncbi:MAG: MlaD family protein [Parachlamydiaceae bacterium]
MADQFKNLMIGLFVTAAAAIVIFILMFLHPHIGDNGKTIHVYFVDVDKITIGTRVTYAGKPIGEVISIDEIKDARKGKTDSDRQLYMYDLTLLVDSGTHIYNTDEVMSRTSGLLGEKSVEISPFAAKPGEELVLMDDKIIYAQDSGSVEETFKEFKAVAEKAKIALSSITDILENVKSNKLVDKITHTVENVDSITTALNKPDQWNDIITNLDHLSANTDKLISSAQKTWGTVDEAVVHARDMMKNGADITHNIAQGEGTLGKLINSEDMYLRTNSILSKVETIMDDINHYGLLFQSDKGWQRLRARRLNLLQKLSSPQEFRNYFNDEINQISTSLSRVYMVMDAVESNPCCNDIMMDREFTKVFAELMRRVSMLEEEVRMYNSQAMESQVHQTELGDAPYCY